MRRSFWDFRPSWNWKRVVLPVSLIIVLVFLVLWVFLSRQVDDSKEPEDAWERYKAEMYKRDFSYPNSQYRDYEGVIVEPQDSLSVQEGNEIPVLSLKDLYEQTQGEVVSYSSKGAYGELVYRSGNSEELVVRVFPGTVVFDPQKEMTVFPSSLSASDKLHLIFEKDFSEEVQESRLAIAVLNPPTNMKFMLLESLSSNADYYVFKDMISDKTYYYSKDNQIWYASNGNPYDIDKIQVGDRFIGFVSSEVYTTLDSASYPILDNLYIVPRRN